MRNIGSVVGAVGRNGIISLNFGDFSENIPLDWGHDQRRGNNRFSVISLRCG